MTFGKFTTKDHINKMKNVIMRFFLFVHLMLNSEKCPKNDPKMHKELQVDDKNMMFGMFATNNHTKNTAYGIIRFFNLCLFYV